MPTSRTTRSVVISGASTGIGRACALHLDRLGWQVFAGVRKDTDAALLRSEASDRLVPIWLDVADPSSVAQAVERVTHAVGSAGLSGLVNNAGIPYGGPVEYLDVDQVRALFEVNYFGVIALTQAFLPLLRLDQGRIVNMSSISGFVASPFVSPYSSSKFALEAFSDSLRMELHPWHIQVSVVEPGAIETPIWDKAGNVLQGVVDNAPQRGLDLYGDVIRGMQPRFRTHGISTEAVSSAVVHALSSSHPKTRYPIGFEGALIRFVSRLPDRLRDWLILSQLPKWG